MQLMRWRWIRELKPRLCQIFYTSKFHKQSCVIKKRMKKGGLSKLLFIKLILCFSYPEITSLDFKLKIGQQYIKVNIQ